VRHHDHANACAVHGAAAAAAAVAAAAAATAAHDALHVHVCARAGAWCLQVVLAALLQPQSWVGSGWAPVCVRTQAHESGYVLRRCESCGAALGLLAVPTLMAGMAAASRHAAWAGWFESSLAASLMLTAAVYAWSTASVPWPPRVRGRPGLTGGWDVMGGTLLQTVALALAGAAASLLVLRRLLPLPESQQQLLPVAMAAIQHGMPALVALPACHCLLTHLPGSFTLGEGLIVAQALCLLLAGAVQQLLSRACHLATPFLVLPAPGQANAWALQPSTLGIGPEEEALFVLLVCTWVLCGAAAVWGLLTALRAVTPAPPAPTAAPAPPPVKRRSQTPERRSPRIAAVAAAAKAAGDGAAATPETNGTAGSSSNISRSGSSSSSSSSSSGRRSRPAIALSVLALAVASLALADLALWAVLRLVHARPAARIGALAGWSATLAAALPAMLRLEAAPSVPHILLRKGYHALALLLFVPPLLYDGPMLRCSLGVAFAAMVASEVGGVLNRWLLAAIWLPATAAPARVHAATLHRHCLIHQSATPSP
jgi:hypothetical protein